MKPYKIPVIVGLLFSVVFYSCDDLLDPKAETNLTEEFANVSYNNTLARSIGLYSYLPDGLSYLDGAMMAAASDEAEYTLETASIHGFNVGSWNANNNPDGSAWERNFEGIFAANLFLKESDEVDLDYLKYDPTKQQDYQNRLNNIHRWKYEARFLRAYYYFELVKRYGGVPIIKEVYDINSDWSNVKRNTYNECVEYIISDLDDVIANLPDRPSERNRVGANAARALKSRVLLYNASALNNPDNDKERWQKASDAAKELLDKGYSLCDNYREMFFDVTNNEYIFAKEFSETYSHMLGFNLACTGDGGRGWATPSQNLVDAYETLDGEIPVLNSESGDINPKSIYNPEKPYENRDPRFYDCIYYNGSTSLNGRIVETFKDGADMIQQDMTMTGYYCRKFVNENEPVSQSHHYTTPFPFFRLAEIYLNYAEAEFQLGHEDVAREYVNKVRARKSVNMPSITDSGEALLKRIYHERQIELAFERHRFFDLRRWKIADNTPIVGLNIIKDGEGKFSYERYVLSLDSRKNEWKDAFFVLPIHYSEIQKSNESLEQNNGY